MEYLESERDGEVYFYDVNALSNFVGDAPRVVGFDPFVRLGDLIARRYSDAAGVCNQPRSRRTTVPASASATRQTL